MNGIRWIAKTAVTALLFMLAATVAAIIYGLVTRGMFTPVYIFNANFLTGAMIMCAALFRVLLPTRLKPDKLLDYSTFNERFFQERNEKRKKAFEYLILGIFVTVFAGLVQILLAWALPG